MWLPEDRGAGVYRGRVGAEQVDDALDRSRAAMLLALEEQIDDSRGLGVTSSSGDFHAFVRLLDNRGRARTVVFTGYPGTRAQPAWLVGALASAPFDQLLEAATLEPASPDADSREFFVERFAETVGADPPTTWVAARMIEIAGVHGTIDLIPSLGRRLCEVEFRGRPRVGYAGRVALSSILALLGSDERVAADDLLDRHQAARWRAACKVQCPCDSI